jgi:hypothetical protein
MLVVLKLEVRHQFGRLIWMKLCAGLQPRQVRLALLRREAARKEGRFISMMFHRQRQWSLLVVHCYPHKFTLSNFL